MVQSNHKASVLSFAPPQGVDFVNEHMAAAAAGEANVTFVSCNDSFMSGGKINQKLMPDALHPNAAGALRLHCEWLLL